MSMPPISNPVAKPGRGGPENQDRGLKRDVLPKGGEDRRGSGEHMTTGTPEPHTGVQGEGGRRPAGAEKTRPAPGAASRCPPEPDRRPGRPSSSPAGASGVSERRLGGRSAARPSAPGSDRRCMREIGEQRWRTTSGRRARPGAAASAKRRPTASRPTADAEATHPTRAAAAVDGRRVAGPPGRRPGDLRADPAGADARRRARRA